MSRASIRAGLLLAAGAALCACRATYLYAPYGNGRDGSITLTRATSPCFQALSASGGDLTLVSTTATIQAGQSVVVLQVQDDVAVPGDTRPIVSPGRAGQWELTRVAGGEGLDLFLDPPLALSYDGRGSRRAEVCLMPEYDSVVVAGSSNVVAPAWDGSSGGLVGFFARSLELDGTISANGAGFRGGFAYLCSGGLDGTAEVASFSGFYGGIGEGLDHSFYGRVGRGNAANGGGGGGVFNAGGGGGGNGGAGGYGAGQASPEAVNPNTAGRGGAPVPVPPTRRLIMGGGGGAGQQDPAGCGDSGPGGSGGGLVLIFAQTLSGSGQIKAKGNHGGDANNAKPVGGSGGGAGGTILLVSDGSEFQGQLQADGDRGGNVAVAPTSTSQHFGTGGGGGGGNIFVGGFRFIRSLSVNGGSHGKVNTGASYGALDGSAGVITFQ